MDDGLTNTHRTSLMRLKLLLLIVACAAAVWLAPRQTDARTADKLSPQQQRGRQIYLKGETGPEIRAVLSNSDIEMPATAFPCANCHGRRGEGTKEGGVQTPPLTWTALNHPATSAMTGRARPAYTESSLKLAISLGRDAAGHELHAAMPHYRMTAEQMDALLAYLKTLGLGWEADPGVSDEGIKVGAALPLTGPLAQAGADIRATLLACFNQVNAEGGIYGRRLVLVAEDSRGDAAGTAAATRRLIEQEEVFALVGSFAPKGSETINDFLQTVETPLIAPVTFSPHLPTAQSGAVFYLLPSLVDQARQLIDFAQAEAQRKSAPRPLRLAVVSSESESESDAATLTDVRAHARARAVELVNEQRAAALDTDALLAARPDAILCLTGPEPFAALGRALEQAKSAAVLLASTSLVGRAAFGLPTEIAARARLTYPGALPGHNDFSEFNALLRAAGLPPAATTFHVMAFAAARIFVAAARASGRQLSRAALVGALEQMREFKLGVLPPVSFDANRRVGATDSYLVGIDLERQRYRVLDNAATR